MRDIEKFQQELKEKYAVYPGFIFTMPSGDKYITPDIYEYGFICIKCREKSRYSYEGLCRNCILKK